MSDYDYAKFCSMMADRSRMEPFVNALRAAVTEESVVLDIGTGTGIFALLACKFGAKRVYAIEPNPLIEVARGFAAEFGYSDRIEFFQEFSTNVELPERADVLICDLRGKTPLLGPNISAIVDARERLLKKDAVMIAEKDTLWFAPVTCHEVYERNISRYLGEQYGFDLRSGKRLLVNRLFHIDPEDLTVVNGPRKFGEIDYRTVTESDISAEMEWDLSESATLHGLRSWFDIDLGFGQTVTTSPDNPGNVYGALFLPFEDPIEISPGERLAAKVSAVLQKGNYTWNWITRVYDADGATEPRLSFSQSLDIGEMIPRPKIAMFSEYFQPERNESAEINRVFLNAMDGEMLLGDIADLLLEEFPDTFKDFHEAMERAAFLTAHYSK